MSYKSKKILSFLFLALTIVLGWQAWLSFSSALSTRKEINDYAAKNKELADVKEKIGQISDFAAENSEAIAKLSLILPDTDAKSNFMSALETMASSNGILIKRMDFPGSEENQRRIAAEGGNKEKNNYESQIVGLSFNATYSALKNFLKTIESSSRIMDIAYFDFKPIEKAGGNNAAPDNPEKTYEFSIKLKTYWQAPDAEENMAAFVEPANFSFIKGKQFTDLISPANYNIVIDKAGELSNPSPF